MIVGAHAIIFSTEAEADRAFLRDTLGLPYVDVGGGWLIFGLPASEVAIHPADENGRHELYFMCEDPNAFVAAMRRRRITCGPVEDQRWGLLTKVTLPGGGTIGVYQPRHARPKSAATARAKRKTARATRPATTAKKAKR
jgi:hypothetical protein